MSAEADILLEPVRRDSGPAIAAGPATRWRVRSRLAAISERMTSCASRTAVTVREGYPRGKEDSSPVNNACLADRN
jgi:hypothetical protein